MRDRPAGEQDGTVLHDVSLIAILAIGLALAFFFGFLAARLRMPPLIGYLFGDATNEAILARTRPERARVLILATPDVLQAERVLKLARAANPSIDGAVGTHSEEELAFIRRHDVGLALMGEQELAAGLARYVLDVCERRAVDGQ